MTIQKAFAVTGCCGEYSDYQDWIVCAYFDHAVAEARRDALNTAATDAGLHKKCKRLDYIEREKALTLYAAKHDDLAQTDYTGLEYFLTEFNIDITPTKDAAQ